MDLPTQQNYENPVRQRAGEWKKVVHFVKRTWQSAPVFVKKL